MPSQAGRQSILNCTPEHRARCVRRLRRARASSAVTRQACPAWRSCRGSCATMTGPTTFTARWGGLPCEEGGGAWGRFCWRLCCGCGCWLMAVSVWLRICCFRRRERMERLGMVAGGAVLADSCAVCALQGHPVASICGRGDLAQVRGSAGCWGLKWWGSGSRTQASMHSSLLPRLAWGLERWQCSRCMTAVHVALAIPCNPGIPPAHAHIHVHQPLPCLYHPPPPHSLQTIQPLLLTIVFSPCPCNAHRRGPCPRDVMTARSPPGDWRAT